MASSEETLRSPATCRPSRSVITRSSGESIPLFMHVGVVRMRPSPRRDRKSTRLNSSHSQISYAVFCLKKKKTNHRQHYLPTQAFDHSNELLEEHKYHVAHALVDNDNDHTEPAVDASRDTHVTRDQCHR